MKLISLLILLPAPIALGQAIAYVPPPSAMYFSTDGSGNPGTWSPVSGGGTGAVTYVPPPTAMYCSSDGTGNKGTWVPCSSTGGGGGVSATWQRVGVVVAPIASDPQDSGAGHIQEISGLVSTTPEILTQYSKVRLFAFTNGWYPTSLGGSGMSICFSEAADDTPAAVQVRFPNCIANHGRSNLTIDPTNGKYLLTAVDVVNSHLDVYEATTISALSQLGSPTFANVLSCGGNGQEAGQIGNGVPAWDATHSVWRMGYGCLYNGTLNYVEYMSSGATLNALSKNQTTPVIGFNSGVTCGGNCVQAGISWMQYVGTKLYGYVGGGPASGAPTNTSYMYEVVDNTGTGLSWTPHSNPDLSSKTQYEGLNNILGQIGSPYPSPTLDGNGTMMYWGTYQNGCSNQIVCGYPSYAMAATIPAPLTTVLTEQQTDAVPLAANTVQVNGLPSSCGMVCNITGPNVVDSGNGTITILPSTVQAFDNFTGIRGTLLTAHADTQGHTWAVYTADGAPGVTSPTLAGSGLNYIYQPSGTSSTAYGDALNSLTPATANYTVSATCWPTNASGTSLAGLYARASSGANTNYVMNVSAAGTASISLTKVVAGTGTGIGSYSGALIQPWNNGFPRTFGITVSGSATTTITVTVNGTTVITATDSTSPITATGQGAIRVSGGGVMVCKNFQIQ